MKRNSVVLLGLLGLLFSGLWSVFQELSEDGSPHDRTCDPDLKYVRNDSLVYAVLRCYGFNNKLHALDHVMDYVSDGGHLIPAFNVSLLRFQYLLNNLTVARDNQGYGTVNHTEKYANGLPAKDGSMLQDKINPFAQVPLGSRKMTSVTGDAMPHIVANKQKAIDLDKIRNTTIYQLFQPEARNVEVAYAAFASKLGCGGNQSRFAAQQSSPERCIAARLGECPHLQTFANRTAFGEGWARVNLVFQHLQYNAGVKPSSIAYTWNGTNYVNPNRRNFIPPGPGIDVVNTVFVQSTSPNHTNANGISCTQTGSTCVGLQCTSGNCGGVQNPNATDQCPIYDKWAWDVKDWHYVDCNNPYGPGTGTGTDPSGTGKAKDKLCSYVPGVKDQWACGSCWDFSATGCFVSHLMLEWGIPVRSDYVTGELNSCVPADVSEQVVLDNAGGGCGGSNTADATDTFYWYRQLGGLALSDETYNSHGNNWTCVKQPRSDPASGNMCNPSGTSKTGLVNGDPDFSVMKVKNAGEKASKSQMKAYSDYLVEVSNSDGSPLSENAIRHLLDTVGPVSIFLYANFDGYAGYGVYDNPVCAKNLSKTACTNEGHTKGWCGADLGINHAVQIVGYGSEWVRSCNYWNYETALAQLQHDDPVGFGKLTAACNAGNFIACLIEGAALMTEVKLDCGAYTYTPVNYWLVKNSWSWYWAQWSPPAGVSSGTCQDGLESGGHIKMRSGVNLCNMEYYVSYPLIMKNYQTEVNILFAPLLNMGINLGNLGGVLNQIMPGPPRDLCFNDDNLRTIKVGGSDFTSTYFQDVCYAHVCNPNRSAEKSDGADGKTIDDMIPGWDKCPDPNWNRNEFHTPDATSLPSEYYGYCKQNKQLFCDTANIFCTNADGTPVPDGATGTTSLELTYDFWNLLLSGGDKSATLSSSSVCRLFRDVCTNPFKWTLTGVLAGSWLNSTYLPYNNVTKYAPAVVASAPVTYKCSSLGNVSNFYYNASGNP